jgi:hypothetical protein
MHPSSETTTMHPASKAAAVHATSKATTAVKGMRRRSNGKRHNKRACAEAFCELVGHPNPPLLRRKSLQGEHQGTATGVRFQMTNAPYSDTEVSP